MSVMISHLLGMFGHTSSPNTNILDKSEMMQYVRGSSSVNNTFIHLDRDKNQYTKTMIYGEV